MLLDTNDDKFSLIIYPVIILSIGHAIFDGNNDPDGSGDSSEGVFGDGHGSGGYVDGNGQGFGYRPKAST